MMKKLLVIGIAGFIGSGKSTLGKFIEKSGGYFINADDIVDFLYMRGNAGYEKIKSFFGVEYLLKNGDLNRRKLAREVFSDKNKLRILNNLIHPMVVQEIKRKVSMIKSGVVALEAVYFEKGFLRDVVDKIIWVDCPKEVLMKRINKERKYDAGVLEKVLELQKKPEKVDFVISNAGNKRDLLGKLKKIWPSLEK